MVLQGFARFSIFFYGPWQALAILGGPWQSLVGPWARWALAVLRAVALPADDSVQHVFAPDICHG